MDGRCFASDTSILDGIKNEVITIAVETSKALVASPGNKLIKRKPKHVDIGLLVTILVLLAMGLMMVLSASAPSALTYNGDSYYYFKSQAKFALVRFGDYGDSFSCGLSYL